MGLKPELVEALNRINFVKATDVQEHVIPVALQGKDVIVRAKTGTGKTCAFLIPIMHNEGRSHTPQALVIVPTRELALQISEVATKLMQSHGGVAVVYGAASMNVQIQALRRNPHLVVGTPGRILDLIERGALRLEGVKFLVLDEADTMLDMGFIDDIEMILSRTPGTRQTMLFSATMPDRILDVAKSHMRDFAYMKIGEEEQLTANKIKHFYTVCDNRMKFANLVAYIKKYNPRKAIIFAQTKYAADEIHNALREQSIESLLMHGGLTQSKREASMRMFKKGGQLLIATNVAARGIDVNGVTDIINFDIPDDPHTYVHRVGRSARMEADGRAFTIVGRDQSRLVEDIEYAAKIRMDRLDLDTTPYKNIQLFRKRGGGDRGGFRRGPSDRRFGDRGGREHGGHGGDRRGGDRGGFRRGPPRDHSYGRHKPSGFQD
ncbi:MAG: DEAD/DEAH box helicase [Candidatus Micrarchaeota archaeon]|nr:DEAD/DEAH box helicase [Candidatus Micrarchaeota archaeon]